MKLLFLDDNENDLLLFSRQLQLIGPDVEIIAVRTEAAFLAELDKEIPSAAIIDAKIIGYSGLKALEALRGRDPSCPAILLTGSLSDEQASQWMDYGFDRAIQKDRSAQLVSVVRRDCRRRDEDRKREDEQRRENRLEAIGSLAAGMAHDQRNKLAVITLASGHGSMLRALVGENNSVLRILDTVQSAALSMGEMIDQLLTFARGNNGSKHKPLSAEFLIGEVASILRDTMDKRVTLNYRVFPGTSNVDGNRTNLEQVLLNLAINAIDAILPNDGDILITAQNITRPGMGLGHWVEFAVRDNGSGIPADVLPNIFLPFYTTKNKEHGTGLGLASVKRIVEDHRGDVEVDTALGKGTTFRVLLPFAMRDQDRPLPPIAAPKGKGQLILLVDDEQMIRDLTADVLDANSYRVLQAGNGLEAISVFRSRPDIDLILTDLMMPKMAGNAFAATARALRPDVKLIYMTGHGSCDAMPEADAILVKPYGPALLLSTIASVIDKPVAERPQFPA